MEETSYPKNFHPGGILPSVPGRTSIQQCHCVSTGIMITLCSSLYPLPCRQGIWSDLGCSLCADTGNLCILYREEKQCFYRGLINGSWLPECFFYKEGFQKVQPFEEKVLITQLCQEHVTLEAPGVSSNRWIKSEVNWSVLKERGWWGLQVLTQQAKARTALTLPFTAVSMHWWL